MWEPYTEIGADMSGRRRRDEWDDGRLDAQDDRRDPWADDSVGDWGGPDADPGDDADRSGATGGGAYESSGAGGGYARGGTPGGKAYAAPAFPSFQATGSTGNGSAGGSGYGSAGPGDDRYAGGSARGAANGQSAGYNGDGYRDAGYGAGRDTYQGAGYGRGADNGGYGRSGYGSSGPGNDSGYGSAGYPAANGRPGGYATEFMPVDNDDMDDEPQAGTPRPYGRLSIYTLHEDMTREFDRLAERAAEGVRTSEPDTLVYVIHVVPKAPMQRIIYEIYRDRGAFLSHERQPHIRQFAADRASCVLATNIIDLRLKYAKVAALGGASEAAAPQASWTPRAAGAAPGGRYDAAPQYSQTQYSSAPQYSPATQYSPAPQYSPPPGAGAAASFTPAKDRYETDNSQVPTVGREAYSPSAQYGNSGNGAYGAGNAQYGAANSNGYSGGAGYANGGSYSSSGYPGSNGYQGANGYPGDNGYSGANGYQSANGYPGANGYSNGSGYSGANGYSTDNGYSGASGNGSGAYGESGTGAHGGPAGPQYTPRYRELTSGPQPDADEGGYPGSGNRYADDGRQSARPQPGEWPPRSQDYR
jgi:quinol monooxygenase YgiN